MSHLWTLRVYYEDTDLAGIVYYANYLRFIERARSEWVRELGVDQAAMKAEDGTAFAVKRVEADYHQPAKYDDVLEVETRVEAATGARLTVWQGVRRGETLLFEARVVLVLIGPSGAPKRLPAEFRSKLL